MDVWSARGKPGITFNPAKGWKDRHWQIPCGYCMSCLIQRSADWGVRALHESTMHPQNCMLTLTYATPYLPEGATVHVRDFQLFMKRLRKRTRSRVRYLHCGEYGDLYKRPHYHVCLFGTNFDRDRVRVAESPRGHPQWASAELQELWPLGLATISELTFESAQYVAQYTVKRKGRDPEALHRFNSETGESWYVHREYITASSRPGIGAPWFDEHWRSVYPDDFVVVNGKQRRPPRYYDLLLSRKDPELWSLVSRNRMKRALARAKALDQEKVDPWRERRAREARIESRDVRRREPE